MNIAFATDTALPSSFPLYFVVQVPLLIACDQTCEMKNDKSLCGQAYLLLGTQWKRFEAFLNRKTWSNYPSLVLLRCPHLWCVDFFCDHNIVFNLKTAFQNGIDCPGGNFPYEIRQSTVGRAGASSKYTTETISVQSQYLHLFKTHTG